MRLLRLLLKSAVVLMALVGLLSLAVLGFGYFAWQQLERLALAPVELPERTLLSLDLASGLPDLPARSPALSLFDGGLTLRETIEAVKAAQRDPRVAGLLLRSGQGALEMAAMQELRAALADFRGAGKPLVAFAETLSGEGGDGTLHYTLASVAEEVWMQPSGDLAFLGFSLETPYPHRFLATLGIEAEVGRRSDYKGAAEPLTREEMSAAVYENLHRLLESWAEQTVGVVARSRNLPEAQVRALLDRPPLFASEALQEGLIDRLGYRDEAEAALDERAGGGAFLSLADYYSARPEEASSPSATGVALVSAVGQIVLADGPPGFGELVMDAEATADAIEEAAADAEARALVLRIDSPGGSYVASDRIWRAVRQAAASGKPVIASLGNVAASGGYFIALGADAIVADPGTVTGSVGVLSGKLSLERLWRNLEIGWSSVEAGENAGYWSMNRPFTEAQRAHLEKGLDRSYADFLAKLAEGRKLPRERLEEVAGGRVWSGADALEAGLIDRTGGLEQAIALALERAGRPADGPYRLLHYPEPERPWQRLLRVLEGGEPFTQSLVRLSALLAPLEPVAARLKFESAGRGGSLLGGSYP